MPPTPGPVLGRFDQKLVGQKQVPSPRGATRDQGGVRRHRVHKGVGGAGTLHAVAALVRTMAPPTRRRGWGTQDPTKNSEHHNTTMLRSGRCGHKDKRTKNTTWMHIGWELKLSFLFGGGTHGFAASKHPTWPLAPWPLRGPPWPKTTRRLVVRILPPPPPGSSQRKEPDDHKPTPEPNIRRSPE